MKNRDLISFEIKCKECESTNIRIELLEEADNLLEIKCNECGMNEIIDIYSI